MYSTKNLVLTLSKATYPVITLALTLLVWPTVCLCACKHSGRTRTLNLIRNGLCASSAKNNRNVESPEPKLTVTCLLLMTYGSNPTSTGLGTGQCLQAGLPPLPASVSSHSFPERDLCAAAVRGLINSDTLLKEGNT